MTFGQWLSFRGRINRKLFWLGYVLPLFVAAVVANALDIALGFAPLPMDDAMPAEAAQVGPLNGLVSLLSIWPSLAGAIKRLHDRDRSGWWIGGLYLLGAMLGSATLATLMAAPQNPAMATGVLAVIGLAMLGYTIWLLVETGFLRGTVGPNRFGPDPLGGGVPGMAQWPVGPHGWHQPQQQWQPPPGQGGYPPQQSWQAPPQGYPPPQGHGQVPPGYGQPPPGYGQPPPGQWTGPAQGSGSVPPVRRD